MRFSIHTFDILASTNLTARQWAEGGAEPGTVIRAVRQSAGRGRQGRSWTTLPGALLFSVILRPSGAPALLPRLAFVTCVCASLAAERCGLPVGWLKWPNDLVLPRRADTAPAPHPGADLDVDYPPAAWAKWGGVLIESGASPGGGLWAVVGVGLNIGPAGDAGAELAALGGASLSDALGEDIDPSWFLDLFLEELGAMLESMTVDPEESWKAILESWRKRDVLRGRPVQVEVSGRSVTGTASGIDDRGALGIRGPAGMMWIDAGDVHLRPAPAG